MHVRFTMSMSCRKPVKASDKILEHRRCAAIALTLRVLMFAIPLGAALVELIGIEPTTPCLQSRCSPS